MARHISTSKRLLFVVVIVKCLHAYFLIKKQHHSLAQFFEPPVHQQEHAKPLRESITYYLCTHEENELIMPEIKDIARQHVRPLFITQKFCGDHLFLNRIFVIAKILM